jgi:hypothetical protein
MQTPPEETLKEVVRGKRGSEGLAQSLNHPTPNRLQNSTPPTNRRHDAVPPVLIDERLDGVAPMTQGFVNPVKGGLLHTARGGRAAVAWSVAEGSAVGVAAAAGHHAFESKRVQFRSRPHWTATT